MFKNAERLHMAPMLAAFKTMADKERVLQNLVCYFSCRCILNLPSMYAEDQGGAVATGCFTHRPSEQRLNFSITTVGAW